METHSTIWFAFVLYASLLLFLGLRANRDRKADIVLGGRNLNRYFIAVAAASAGNSGFIMTGAVGLGYAYGAQWILLPLAWLVGDIVFWLTQPRRLNSEARRVDVRTIPSLLVSGFSGRSARWLRTAMALVIVCVILLYACSQFIASGKMFGVFLGVPGWEGVIITGLVVGLYCVLGGIRAAVWTDVAQAVAMVATCFIVLITSITLQGGIEPTWTNITSGETAFYSLSGGMKLGATVGFVLGWASAAFGFGLSQPHVVLMFFAGKSPEETRGAMWLYLLLLQFTWIAMTTFGMTVKTVLPAVGDPESVVAVFSLEHCSPLFAGIIFIGVFSAIASTIDALSISATGIVLDDFRAGFLEHKTPRFVAATVILMSVALTSFLPSNVFATSSMAVSLLACTIGPAMLVKLARPSVGIRVLSGLFCFCLLLAIAWRQLGYSATVNEALPAMCAGALTLLLLHRGRRNLTPVEIRCAVQE